MLCNLKIEKNDNIIETINVGTSFDEEMVKKLKLATRLDWLNTVDYLVDVKELFEEWLRCLMMNNQIDSAVMLLINIPRYTSLDSIMPYLENGSLDSIIVFLYALKTVCGYTEDSDLNDFAEKYNIYIEVL